MTCDDVPMLIALLIERPVRWAKMVGDYDGRERTLEVFNADAADQRRLLGCINRSKDQLVALAGGPLTIIFHSTRQSARYADFIGDIRKFKVLKQS